MEQTNWKPVVIRKDIDPIRMQTWYLVNSSVVGANYTFDYVIDQNGLVWYEKIHYCDENPMPYYHALDRYDKGYAPIYVTTSGAKAALEAIRNYERNLGNATKF